MRIGPDRTARIPYTDVASWARQALAVDLMRLAAVVPISAHARREQFAICVDVYNELSVDLILDH